MAHQLDFPDQSTTSRGKGCKAKKGAGNRRWEGIGQRARRGRESSRKIVSDTEMKKLKIWRCLQYWRPSSFPIPSLSTELSLFPILSDPHFCSSVTHFMHPLQLRSLLHLHRLIATHRKILKTSTWGAFWSKVGARNSSLWHPAIADKQPSTGWSQDWGPSPLAVLWNSSGSLPLLFRKRTKWNGSFWGKWHNGAKQHDLFGFFVPGGKEEGRNVYLIWSKVFCCCCCCFC